MADHRAEQIIAAVVQRVTGLATTGANVQRDNAYPFADTVSAGLAVLMGTDDRNPESPWPLIYSTLTVHIEISVRGGVLDATLNQVRKEVVIALMADYTLGLSFVHQIREGAASAPQMDYAEKPTALQTVDFEIDYQRSYSDPSQ